MPTYNEEKNIAKVIMDIKAIDRSWDIIVVDGGSSDNTTTMASQYGARVLDFNKKGKGNAIKHAFSDLDHDFLVMLDADNTYPTEAIPKMLDKLKQHDLVSGSRFTGAIEDGAMSLLNRIGNMYLTLLANSLYPKKTSDLCTGVWGFTKKAYKQIEIDAKNFEVEANFFVGANKNQLKLSEVPITYRRRSGQSKISVLDGFWIAFYLIKSRF